MEADVASETARPGRRRRRGVLRLSLAQSLEFRGYEVIGVLNGADVLQKIRVTLRRPDLILIDLKMPVLAGQHNEAEKLAAIAIDQLKEIVAFD